MSTKTWDVSQVVEKNILVRIIQIVLLENFFWLRFNKCAHSFSRLDQNLTSLFLKKWKWFNLFLSIKLFVKRKFVLAFWLAIREAIIIFLGFQTRLSYWKIPLCLNDIMLCSNNFWSYIDNECYCGISFQ